MANNRQQRTAKRSTGILPVANFRDPVRVISDPQMIEGFRRVGVVADGIREAHALWSSAAEHWQIIWKDGQVIYVPSIDQVLSRLAGAGCDTITIQRKRRP